MKTGSNLYKPYQTVPPHTPERSQIYNKKEYNMAATVVFLCYPWGSLLRISVAPENNDGPDKVPLIHPAIGSNGCHQEVSASTAQRNDEHTFQLSRRHKRFPLDVLIADKSLCSITETVMSRK
ncbi:hypothetical protein CDAR_459431 [Caerostris darwini]|uniref:Uncharacterized protein n=1 Tax=Caerostris darwini TaxID=1538125 RepID=A0AAV4UDA9_9ARAC|nr:hypothetical protein CDAR_459431 [Caerostris darwini]